MRQAPVRNAAAAAGMLLILIAVFGLDKDSPFPGWRALLPVLGAALVIAGGSAAWTNRRILSSAPLVFVGLISYPLYLWHWPLLSFARIAAAGEPGAAASAGLVALAFLLAWLTWRLVEIPIRFKYRRSPAPVAALCLGLTVCAVTGLTCYYSLARGRLDSPPVRRIDSARGDWDYPGSEYNFRRAAGFRLVSETGALQTSVLFIGDSHLEQYWSRAHAVLRGGQPGTKSILFATSPGCPPVPGVNRIEPGYACDRFLDFAIDKARSDRVDTVVFGAAWEAYFLDRRAGEGPRNVISAAGDPSRAPVTLGTAAGAQVLAGFQRQIEELVKSGKRVYIILPNPTSSAFSPAAMLPDRLSSDAAPRGAGYVSRGDFAAAVRPIVAQLEAIAAKTGARVVDPMDYFCEQTVCRTVTRDGVPVYSDSNHMRPFYVREKAAFIDRMVVAEDAVSSARRAP